MEDQLQNMSKIKSLLDNSVAVHNSRPPLRWFANLAGSIASKNILKISYMEDMGNTGIRYKYYGLLWRVFWPIYQKFGTFYQLDVDMPDSGCNDYDDSGASYWEKWELDCICKNCDEDTHCLGCMDCDNDFIDEDTGDAFRIIGTI